MKFIPRSSFITHRSSLIITATLLSSLFSCNRDCVCKGYDGGEYIYTEEDLDARGVNCPNMIFQAGQQYYSVCDWE